MPPLTIDPSLREGHRKRLKNRFMRFPESVSDEELLEIALGYVQLRRDTKPQARLLLQKFKSLGDVLRAGRKEISEVEGCGDSIEMFFRIINELNTRISLEKAARRESVTLADIAKVATQRLYGLNNEEVWLALLDKQNRLLNFSRASAGGASSVYTDPIRIVEAMLSAHAGRIVLIHNHPGGDPAPSNEDIRLTENLGTALQSLGLELSDHLIISGDRCFSMRLSRLIGDEAENYWGTHERRR